MAKQDTSSSTGRRVRAVQKPYSDSSRRSVPKALAAPNTDPPDHEGRNVVTPPLPEAKETQPAIPEKQTYRMMIEVRQNERAVDIRPSTLEGRAWHFAGTDASVIKSLRYVLADAAYPTEDGDICSLSCDRWEDWDSEKTWRDFFGPYSPHHRVFADVWFQAPSGIRGIARVYDQRTRSFVTRLPLPDTTDARLAAPVQRQETRDSSSDWHPAGANLDHCLTLKLSYDTDPDFCQVLPSFVGRPKGEMFTMRWARTLEDAVRFACLLHDVPFSSSNDIIQIDTIKSGCSPPSSDQLAVFHGAHIWDDDLIEVELR